MRRSAMIRSSARWTSSAAAALLVALACRVDGPLGPKVMRPGTWDIVHEIPGDLVFTATSSPDGAVFLVTFDGALWRGVGSSWARVADAPGFVHMYAPSRDLLFGVSGPRIYRWTPASGVTEDSTPTSKETLGCGDFFTSADQFTAVGGRGPGDVYAVGKHGLIVHWDGARWTTEPNPLRDRAPSNCWSAYDTDLTSVAANADGVSAAVFTSSILEKGADATWREVPRPADADASGFYVSAVAQRDRVLFGGGDFQRLGDAPPYEFRTPARLLARAGGSWRVESVGLAGVGDLNGGGTGHLTGPAVFWRFDEQVVVVRGERVRAYTFPELRLRGAVPVGDAVYVIGRTVTDGSVVLRLRE